MYNQNLLILNNNNFHNKKMNLNLNYHKIDKIHHKNNYNNNEFFFKLFVI